MNTRWWIVPSIALVAIAAAQCGGDDNAVTETSTTGSSGSTGSGGGATTGSGGAKSGTGGSNETTTGSATTTSGTAGSAGSGGGTTTSTGATTGTGGTTGSTGTGGSGGATDAGKSDATTGTGGASDAGRSDAPARDAADGSACPLGAPMDTDPCTTADPMFCTYGDIGCACVRIMGMRREWRCRGLADAGRDADCPSMPPAQGTSCADAGAGTVCRYPGNTLCACGMMDQWVCTL